MLLQHPVEVNRMVGDARKGAHPSQVILSDRLGLVRLTSRSMHALPRACSEATRPFFHVMMAPSLLSSSLSRARSCFCSSSSTADVAAAPREGEDLHPPSSHNQHHHKNQAHAIASVD
jgi:hypothetical protein